MTKRPPSAGDSVQFQTQWWIERFGFYLPAVLTVPGSRGEVANGLRLDMLIDDQIINCVEVISAAATKAILVLRVADGAAREHATNRGIGVVSSLSQAITVLERLHEVLPHRRGRLMRLREWFSPTAELQSCRPIRARFGRCPLTIRGPDHRQLTQPRTCALSESSLPMDANYA